MADPLDPLLEALRAAGEEPDGPVRLATVTGGSSTTINVRFDGEASASSRAYPKTYAPAYVNDRVIMLRTGSTWTAIGRIPNSATPQQRVATRGVLSPAQTVNPGAWTRVTNWSGVEGIGSTGITFVGSGQWRIDYAGWYRFDFGFAFNNGGWGGARFGSIAVNGALQVSEGYSMQGIESHIAGGFLAWEARMAVNYLVDFQVYQDSPATLNLATNSDARTFYTIRRVDD